MNSDTPQTNEEIIDATHCAECGYEVVLGDAMRMIERERDQLKRELAEAKGELLTVGDDYREACNEIERHRAKLAEAEKIQATMEEAIAIKNKLYSELSSELAKSEATMAYQREVLQHAAIRIEDQKSQLLALSSAYQRQKEALTVVIDSAFPNKREHPAMYAAWKQAEAALAETPDVSLWKPMDSAPKDTAILLYWPHWCKTHPLIGCWSPIHRCWVATEALTWDIPPTLWMPTPPLPTLQPDHQK